MKLVFEIVLFGNAIFALCLLMVALQLRRSDDRLTSILIFFTSSSMVWSLGSGALVIQETALAAHVCRCIDLAGTVGYMIAIIMFMGQISEVPEKLRIAFLHFANLGFFVWLAGFLPGVFDFSMSEWGMTFSMKNQVYGIIYLTYFIACSLIMLVNMILMLRSEKKSVRFFAKNFIGVWIVILTGSFTDMILPMLNSSSAPGSSIAQFWGLIIVWYAIDNLRSSNLTIKNMSTQLYNASSTPIVMATTDGFIKVCNEAAIAFFGVEKDEQGYYGNLNDFFTLPDDVDVSQRLEFLTFDATCKSNNVFCNIISNTVHDDFGDVIGYISLFTDLTKQQEDKAKIEEARQEAIDANRAKTLFLANMSHEIRTPVNAIMGFSELALAENTSPQVHGYLSDIKNASGTLLSSINDILNISKIESGKMDIVNEEYLLKSLLGNVVKIIDVQAKSKNLQFKVNVSGFVPDKLLGDDVRIQEILINLCNNAVKYTNQGSVVLNISGTRENNGNVKLRMAVKDTGIGIKENDLKTLFAAYERMDKEKNHRAEGTGLGLAIVRSYIELMDGDIEVKSEYGKGSEFIVSIEQKIIDETLMDTSDLIKRENKGSRFGNVHIKDTKVLVVDDNRINLKVVSKTLEKYGVASDLALSGTEAVSMCKNAEYPLVLMDHMMPEMDGVETMTELRKQYKYYRETAKIVVLTANAIDGVREELIAAGFDDYLSKPLNYEELERVLKETISPEKIEILTP